METREEQSKRCPLRPSRYEERVVYPDAAHRSPCRSPTHCSCGHPRSPGSPSAGIWASNANTLLPQEKAQRPQVPVSWLPEMTALMMQEGLGGTQGRPPRPVASATHRLHAPGRSPFPHLRTALAPSRRLLGRQGRLCPGHQRCLSGHFNIWRAL